MPAIALFQQFFNNGRKLVILDSPGRGDQEIRRGLTGETFHGNPGIQQFQVSHHQQGIFFRGEKPELRRIFPVLKGHDRPLVDLHLVKFQVINRQPGNDPGLFQPIVMRFPRQPQDHMGRGPDTSLRGGFQRCYRFRKGVTPVDPFQCGIEMGLQSHFKHQVGFSGKFRQIIQDFRIQTVGTRCNHQSHHAGVSQGFFIQLLQNGQWSIGVAVGLKIGQKLHSLVFAGEKADPFLHLAGYTFL